MSHLPFLGAQIVAFLPEMDPEQPNDPVPISEPVEEAILRILRLDLLEQYQGEKERHREEKKAIETAKKRARQMIRRLFGPLRERKESELEAEYLERVQGEDDRHARFLAELRETIRDYARAEEPDSSTPDDGG